MSARTLFISAFQRSIFQPNPSYVFSMRSISTRPKYLTPRNDITQSLVYVRRQVFLLIKYTLYTAAAASVTTYAAWKGYHFYIEQQHPTPSELGTKVRNLLRGAYVREKVSPDLDIAVAYLRNALMMCEKDEKLKSSSPAVLGIRERLAEDLRRAGRLNEAAAEYLQLWRVLVYADKTQKEKATEIGKKLGDLYTRLGDYDYAEEKYEWTINELGTQNTQEKNDIKINHQEITLMHLTTIALANMKTMRRNYDEALPLYLHVLNQITNLPNQSLLVSEQNSEDVYVPSPGCLSAILHSSISEVIWGMKKHDDALNWAQKGLEIAKNGKGEKGCDECAFTILQNLGGMLEIKDNLPQSLAYYNLALEAAQTSIATQESQANIARVKGMMDAREHEHHEIEIERERIEEERRVTGGWKRRWFGFF